MMTNTPLRWHALARTPVSIVRPAQLLLIAAGLSAAVFPAPSFADNGQWAADSGGDWSSASNWEENQIASGVGAIATFATGNGGTIVVDSEHTVGHLVFEGTKQWQVRGGKLTLEVGDPLVGAPTITIAEGYHIIRNILDGTQGFRKLGDGTMYLQQSSNTYSGVTYIEGGQVYIRNNSSLGAVGAGNGTVVLRTSSASPRLHIGPAASGGSAVITQEDITLRYEAVGNANTAGYINDRDSNEQAGALILERAGSGAASTVYTFGVDVIEGKLTISGDVSGSLGEGAVAGNAGTDANRLRINTATDAVRTNAVISGVIADGSIGAGGLSLYKVGTGILRLTNANTYSGSTVHSEGLLLVNNASGSGTGVGALSVSSGAEFGGIGTVAPEGDAGITFAAGSTVAPGDTDDSGLSLAAGEVFSFDLSKSSGNAVFAEGAFIALDFSTTQVDRIDFAGLTAEDVRIELNDNVVNFFSTGGGVLADGVYTILSFDAANAYSGSLTLGTGLEGYEAAFLYNADSIQLQIGMIPEPAAVAALTMGLAAFGVACVRRRNSNKR